MHKIKWYFKTLWRHLRATYLIFKSLRYANKKMFSHRLEFWEELRPLLEDPITRTRIAWPDGIGYIKASDFDRAKSATKKHK